MTISKETFQQLQILYDKAFTTYKNPPDNKKVYQGYKLYCWDILANIRSISLPYTYTCKDMCIQLFSKVINLLESGFECVAICLDPYGNSRPEKAHTQNKRKYVPKGEFKQKEITLPPGRKHYFEHNLPLLGDMNLIFSKKEARIELYDYLTSYLISDEFKKKIPKGKKVVLSGGLIIKNAGYIENNNSSSSSSSSNNNNNNNNMKYFINYDDYENVYAQEITCDYHKCIKSIPRDVISEGDNDVWRLAYIFKDYGNTVIESRDGDVLVIGLIHMKNLYNLNKQRKIIFKTRRSVGDTLYTKKELENHKLKFQTFQKVLNETGDIQKANIASGGIVTPRPTRTKKIKWAEIHVDMVKLFREIWKQHLLLDKEIGLKYTRPIEQLIIIICFSATSHDYFKRQLILKGCSPEVVMKTYANNLLDIGKLVEVFKQEKASLYHKVYGVYHEEIRKFVELCHIEAKRKVTKRESKSHQNKSNKEFDDFLREKALEKLYIDLTKTKLGKKAQKNEIEDYIKQGKKIFEDNILVASSQIAWILHYYNNIHNLHEIVNGTKPDEKTGLSIHGYVKGGFATKVLKTTEKIRICGLITSNNA